MDVDETPIAAASTTPAAAASSASDDSCLGGSLAPVTLRRAIFHCFTSNEPPAIFISKLNDLINESLLSTSVEPVVLVQALIDAACSNGACHPLLFGYLDALLECRHFDYSFYITVLTSYTDLTHTHCVLSFVRKVGELLKQIDCDFRSTEALHQFCDAHVTSLRWFCSLLRGAFEERLDSNANFDTLISTLIEHIHFFSINTTARYVLFYSFHLAPDVHTTLIDLTNTAIDAMNKTTATLRSAQLTTSTRHAIEQLPKMIAKLATPLDFPLQQVQTYRFGTHHVCLDRTRMKRKQLLQSQPAILTLIAVHSMFRVLRSDEEIADAIINVGEIMMMSRGEMLASTFRGALLTLLESANSTIDDEQTTERRRRAEVFVYKRLGRVVARMLDAHSCSSEDLQKFLFELARNSELLDALDCRQMENVLLNILERSKLLDQIGETKLAEIITLRVNMITANTEWESASADYQSPYPNGNPRAINQNEKSRYGRFLKADKTASRLAAIENDKDVAASVAELLESTSLEHVDLVLNCLCADAQLQSYASMLASVAARLEQIEMSPTTSNDTIAFDATFLLLSRIRQSFGDLRLEEITENASTSTFHQWTKKREENGRQTIAIDAIASPPLLLDDDERATMIKKLREGIAPWPKSDDQEAASATTTSSRSSIGWSGGRVIAHLPAICAALVDSTNVASESTSSKADEETIKNLLVGFDNLASSSLICIVQWLEMMPSDEMERRAQVAGALLAAAAKYVARSPSTAASSTPQQQQQSSGARRWSLAVQMVMPTLRRLARGVAIARPPAYPWLVVAARHEPLSPLFSISSSLSSSSSPPSTTIPTTTSGDRDDDGRVLIIAFLYATQQGWASGDVLACLDHLTRQMRHDRWMQCFIAQMTKQTNVDELEASAELCVGAAMLQPIACLVSIVHALVDDTTFARATPGFNHVWVLARMLVRVALLLCWAEDRRRTKRRQFLQWRHDRKRRAVDDLNLNLNDDVDASSFDDSLLDSTTGEMKTTTTIDSNDITIPTIGESGVHLTLRTIFQKFFKEIKPALVRAKVVFISTFMMELANAPSSVYRDRLLSLVPDEMIYALVRLEPTFFNLPLLLRLYDTNVAKHRLTILQLVCLLRKLDLA